MLRKNQQREQLLKLGRKLNLAADSLKETPSEGDRTSWGEVQDTLYELHERLRILDVGTYSGVYDQWFFTLQAYVDAVLQAVIEEGNFNRTYSLTTETPNKSTRTALRDANDRHKPISIFLNIEEAIRMEFFDFKNKWDVALPS